MSSKRETALAALYQTLVDAAIAGVEVTRNLNVPTSERELGVKALVNVVDGEPGEPEIYLSPTTYHYDHAAALEVITFEDVDGDVDAEHDTVLVAVKDALIADTTLGGALSNPGLLLDAPQDLEMLDMGGQTPCKGSSVPCILSYDTTNPLA